jgi:hypothetical protein
VGKDRFDCHKIIQHKSFIPNNTTKPTKSPLLIFQFLCRSYTNIYYTNNLTPFLTLTFRKLTILNVRAPGALKSPLHRSGYGSSALSINPKKPATSIASVVQTTIANYHFLSYAGFVSSLVIFLQHSESVWQLTPATTVSMALTARSSRRAPLISSKRKRFTELEPIPVLCN